MESLLKFLPEDSFVEFSASAVANPIVLWKTKAPDLRFDPLQYAYAMRLPEESYAAYRADRQTFLAERYGGAGVGGNSGGVRCGNIAGIQIKGIGRNPLAGTTTDYWHKHGAASIQDCIREAIWSEILAVALPFGAVRTLGIIGTGTVFEGELPDKSAKVKIPRALLLREHGLRPAHFMRSIFAAPSNELKGCSDVDRTKAAIGAAAQFLDLLNQTGTAQGQSKLTTVGEGIVEVFRRATHQVASSRAKRLIHGSLIPSNYTVDGKWLDFGTISALEDHGRAIVAPGSADFWEQQVPVFEAMGDLHFYLSKYLAPEHQRSLPTLDELQSCTNASFRALLEAEFLKLTGVPTPILDQVSESYRRDLFLVMMQVMMLGNERPYLYFGDDRHPMPALSGVYSLSRALLCCVTSASREGLSRDLSHIKQPLRDRFVNAFWDVREQAIFFARSPIQARALALAIRGMRLNMSLATLYRRALDGAIASVVTSGANVEPFIDATALRWRNQLGETSDGSVLLHPWFTTMQGFSISRDLYLLQDDAPMQIPIRDFIQQSSVSTIEKQRLFSLAPIS